MVHLPRLSLVSISGNRPAVVSAAGDAGWGRGAAPAGNKDDATTRLCQTFAPGTHVAPIS